MHQFFFVVNFFQIERRTLPFSSPFLAKINDLLFTCSVIWVNIITIHYTTITKESHRIKEKNEKPFFMISFCSFNFFDFFFRAPKKKVYKLFVEMCLCALVISAVVTNVIEGSSFAPPILTRYFYQSLVDCQNLNKMAFQCFVCIQLNSSMPSVKIKWRYVRQSHIFHKS